MEDEFDKLMKLLSGKAEEKEKQLDEIFQRCTEFFDRYKYVLAEGTSAEKEAIQKKMNILRDRLKEENTKAQTKLGISSEEIKNLAEEAKNFTPDQWEFLKNAQSKLFQEKDEREKLILEDKKNREAELKLKSKKKSTSRKSNWMKS